MKATPKAAVPKSIAFHLLNFFFETLKLPDFKLQSQPKIKPEEFLFTPFLGRITFFYKIKYSQNLARSILAGISSSFIRLYFHQVLLSRYVKSHLPSDVTQASFVLSARTFVNNTSSSSWKTETSLLNRVKLYD